jgi:hypothetical protein
MSLLRARRAGLGCGERSEEAPWVDRGIDWASLQVCLEVEEILISSSAFSF